MKNSKIQFRVLALVGVALLAIASGCKKDPDSMAKFAVSRISSKLDLTDEQKTKLNVVKDELLRIRKAQEGERKENIESVKKMILSDKLSATEVKTLMVKRQKIVDDNFDTVFTKVSDFHASLKPEQKKEAVELLEDFTDRWN